LFGANKGWKATDILAAGFVKLANLIRELSKHMDWVNKALGMLAIHVGAVATDKFITWLSQATTGTLSLATALRKASTAAKTLGRVLVYYLVLEAIDETIAAYRRLEKFVKQTPFTWKDAALISVDWFVNGIINGLQALGQSMIDIMRVITDPIIAIFKQMWKELPSLVLGDATEAMKRIGEAAVQAFNQAVDRIPENFKRIMDQRLVEIVPPEVWKRWKEFTPAPPPKPIAPPPTPKPGVGLPITFTEEDQKKLNAALARVEKMVREAEQRRIRQRVDDIRQSLQEEARVLESFQDDFMRATLEPMDYELWKLKELKEYRKKYVYDKLALDKWYTIEANKIIDKYMQEQEKAFDYLEEMSKRTAQSMEQNFSNFFYDAITGNLKSLGDYFVSFANNLLKIWSDLMAKMAMEALVRQGKRVFQR